MWMFNLSLFDPWTFSIFLLFIAFLLIDDCNKFLLMNTTQPPNITSPPPINGTSPTPPPTDPVYVYTHYALSALYALLACFTLSWMIFKCITKSGKMEFWKAMFFVLIVVACIIRGTEAILNPLYLGGLHYHFAGKIDLLLNFYPSILFFTDYIILLFLWIEIYHFDNRRSGLKIKRTRLPLLIVIIVMHVIYFLLFIVDLIVYGSENWEFGRPPRNVTDKIMVIYIAVLYCLSCVLYFVYGFLMWRKLKETQNIVEVFNMCVTRMTNES